MSKDMLGAIGTQTVLPPAVKAASQPDQQIAVPRAVPAPETPPTRKAVEASARQIESYLKSTGRELEFRVDEDSGQMVVSVRDATTGELIRQIPGEAVLRMARALKEEAVSFVSLTV